MNQNDSTQQNLEIAYADFCNVYKGEWSVRHVFRAGWQAALATIPGEYAEGQWWLKELDDLVKAGTPDQKRAVYGVVRKLMREVNAIEKPNYRYYIREIGEGDWQEVSYSRYAEAAGDPHIDYKREEVEAEVGQAKQDGGCPECGRKKAESIDDCAAGLCPKWYAIRDEAAVKDCQNALQAQQPRGNLAINNLAKQILSDCGFHADHDKDVYHRIRSRIIESQAQQATELSDKCKVAASCLTYNDTKKEAVAKHLLLEASQQLRRVQAQQERQWISVEEAKATLKDGDLVFAYCEFYGVVEAIYAFEEGYYNPHRIVKKNGDSYRINTFTHFMIRKPTPIPPAPEGGDK